MDPLFSSLTVSASGMQAYGERIRVISENVANVGTAANTPDGQPYARKLITFSNELDRQLGQRVVKVEDITDDRNTPFPEKYLPDHPGADERGYVRMPNVNLLVELSDMREAQRSYEANLGMLDQTRGMYSRTIDLLR